MNIARTLAALVPFGLLVTVTMGMHRIDLAAHVGDAATFEVQKYGKPICVPARVAGQERTFLIDTGCTSSLLDKSLRSSSGQLVSTEIFSSGDLRVDVLELFEPPEIFLGSMEVGHNQPIGVIDLAKFPAADGRPLSGIVGMSSLRDFALQIDFDRGRMTLLDEHHQHGEWGHSVPLMATTWGMPTVLLSASGLERQFAIDTGSCSTQIDRQLLRQLKDRNAVVPVGHQRFQTLLGNVDAEEYRLTCLSVAVFEHEDLVVHVGSMNMIGRDYLSRYQVTFDFPHWRMYLTKGPLYDRNSDPNRSGLTLRCDHGRIMVDAVEPNSAACEADLKVGDELIRINDDDPRTMSLFEIRRLLGSEDGSEIPVEISRPGETICSVLTLKPMASDE